MQWYMLVLKVDNHKELKALDLEVVGKKQPKISNSRRVKLEIKKIGLVKEDVKDREKQRIAVMKLQKA